MIHLDTHVVVWLAAGLDDKLPPTVAERLENDDVAVSPMVHLELVHLHEIERLRHRADRVLASLRSALGLRDDPTPFAEVVAAAESLTWTRDPFDRLITAQAVAAGCPLVTADAAIAAAMPHHVLWE